MVVNSNKKRKWNLIVTVVLLLFVLSIPASMAHNTADSSQDIENSIMVMATWIGNGDNPEWNDLGFDVLEEYENSVLAMINPDVLDISSSDILITEIESESLIETRTMNFDPSIETDFKTNNDDLHLIQMIGPINQNWIQVLEDNSAEIIHYVNNNAFLVELHEEYLPNIHSEHFVRATVPYGREFRLHPELTSIQEEDSMAINVLIRPDEYTESRIWSISDREEKMFSLGNNIVYNIEMSADMIDGLARIPGLIWAEPSYTPELHGEVGTEIVGGTYSGDGGEITYHGYTGDGVTVSVVDTGMDTGEKSTMHPDLRGRIKELYYYGHAEHAGDKIGHGTHVAGTVAGDGSTDLRDENGYLYGHGTAPEANIVSQKIFDDNGFFAGPDFDELNRDTVESSSMISSNSWGAASGGHYTLLSAAYDSYTRDANVFTDTDEPLLFVISAGNSGPLPTTIGAPGTAKNVITVGASENYRPSDGGVQADNPDEIAFFSSRGPTVDGRVKPDIVAPGTYVSSALSSMSRPGWAYGSPDGEYYEFCSGTSMSSPYVSGGAAAFMQFYEETYQNVPSPSLVRAALINGAVDLDDAPESSPIPNINEGWGRMDLTNTLLTDGSIKFTDQVTGLQTGESYGETITVMDSNEPLKITMAYTDVPGSPDADKSLVNNLNLEVIGPDGTSYIGNALTDGWSDSSIRETDDVNNVHNVFIEEPMEGDYHVVVYGDSVPMDAVRETEQIEQDFSLVFRGGIEGSSVGTISMDKPYYGTDDTVTIEVYDSDLNIDNSTIQDITVKVSSDYPDGEQVVLTQTESDSSRFVGTLELTEEKRDFNDGRLQVKHGSEITAIYFDNSPYGERRTTAEVIGLSPMISDVEITSVASNEVRISFATDIKASSTIYWRTLEGEWNEKSINALDDIHHILIEGLVPETDYEFYVEVKNIVGHETIDDNEGSYYTFTTENLPDILLVVDHDEEIHYSQTLQNLGYDFELWNLEERGTPSANKMRDYEVVLWSTYNNFDTLDLDQQEVLGEYLDHNGKLYLSSQRLIKDIGITQFTQDYLLISDTHIDLNAADNVTGVENDIITDGMGPFDLTYPFWGGHADNVYPSESGTEIFVDQIDEPVAIRSNDTDLPFRSVFTSFPFEAIAEEDMENAEEVMESILDWLIVEYDVDVSVRDLEFSESWVRPGESVEVEAIVSNDGNTDLDNIDVNIYVDNDLVNSKTIDTLSAGENQKVILEVISDTIGELEVSFEIPPLDGEVEIEDNVMSGTLYCRDPEHTVNVSVLRSYGTLAPIYGEEIMWQELSETWWKYGNVDIEIDYESLNILDITYDDIEATGADVIYLSNAWSNIFQYTESERNAIENYVASGRGIIASGGTFSEDGIDRNMELAHMFGLDTSVPGIWSADFHDPFNIVVTDHPIFENVGDVYNTGNNFACANHHITHGDVIAFGESSGFIGPDFYAYFMEAEYGGGNTIHFPNVPEYGDANRQDKTVLYNSMVRSYENSDRQENQIGIKTIDEPEWGESGDTMYVEGEVRNLGELEQNDVKVNLYVDEDIVDEYTVSNIVPGETSNVNMSWVPSEYGDYTIKLEAEPVDGETFTDNNVAEFDYKVLDYGGHLNIAVIDGFGTYFSGNFYRIYESLENEWYRYGNYSIEIDYTSLSSLEEHSLGEELPEITYEDLVNSEADVLLNAGYPIRTLDEEWNLSDSEISAIENFTKDGAGFVWTGGFWETDYWGSITYNNRKLMPMFGLDPDTDTVRTFMNVEGRNFEGCFDLLEPEHSIFEGIEDPYTPSGFINYVSGQYIEGTTARVHTRANVTTANILAESTEDIYDDIWVTERKAGAGQTVYSSFNPMVNGESGFMPQQQDIRFLYNLLAYAYENTTYSSRIIHDSRASIGLDTSIEVEAEIIPYDNEIVEASLYYKGTLDESYNLVSMDNIQDDEWTAEIPPQQEVGEIQYYIEAQQQDGTIVTSPNQGVYSTVVDSQPPSIEHQSPEYMYIDQPETIFVEVVDEFGISDVTMTFIDTTGEQQDVKMNSIGDNSYTGIITPQSDIGDINYRISATDVNGNENVSEEYSIEVYGHLLKINVVDSYDVPIGHTSGLLENRDTGESINFETDNTGRYKHPLALLNDGYSVGDILYAESMFEGMKASNSLEIDSEDGVLELTITFDTSVIDEVKISPIDTITVNAGDEIEFTAEAYDEFNNLITDSTKDFSWTNAVDGVFSEEKVGEYEITATYGPVRSTSVIVVVEPTETHFVQIDPVEDLNIIAGETIEFDSEVYDEYGNLITDVNSDFLWENTDNGIFEETTAGEYVVTSSYDGVTSETITVTVEPAEVSYVDIESSEDQTLTAGEIIEFSAEAYDGYGNLITDDNSDFIWKNTENGLFDETSADDYLVSATYGEVTSEHVTISVEPSDVDNVEIGPDDQVITAGETIDFTAAAYDEYGNLITDTDSDFIWENTDESGLFDNHIVDEYEIKASFEDVGSNIVTVDVEHSRISNVYLCSSDDQVITAGETIEFSAEAYDEYGNLITDEKLDFIWENTDNGLFEETAVGEYTITATYGQVTSIGVNITVQPSVVNSVIIEESDILIVSAGESVDLNANAYDEYGNLITEVNSDFTWVNADDGLFLEEVTGEFEVTARYEDMTSNIIEVRVEPAQVETVEITPMDSLDVKAGEVIEFEAEARDEFGNLITTNTEDFDWENTVDGLFLEEKVDEYQVTASYKGVTSNVNIITVYQPYFEIELSDYDEIVKTGEKITIYYTVRNTGGIDGTQHISLMINDRVYWVDTDLSLGAGEEFSGEYTWEPTEAGEYNIVVSAEDDSELISIEAEEEEEDTSIFGLIGWIIALIAISLLVWMVLKDRNSVNTDINDDDKMYNENEEELIEEDDTIFEDEI